MFADEFLPVSDAVGVVGVGPATTWQARESAEEARVP